MDWSGSLDLEPDAAPVGIPPQFGGPSETYHLKKGTLTAKVQVTSVLDGCTASGQASFDVVAFSAGSTVPVLAIDDLRTRYYIRITVADQPLVLAQIARALGEGGISISSVIQKETFVDDKTAELVIMTHEAREASMQRALTAVRNLTVVESIGNFLRVEHL